MIKKNKIIVPSKNAFSEHECALKLLPQKNIFQKLLSLKNIHKKKKRFSLISMNKKILNKKVKKSKNVFIVKK